MPANQARTLPTGSGPSDPVSRAGTARRVLAGADVDDTFDPPERSSNWGCLREHSGVEYAHMTAPTAGWLIA